MQTNPASEPTTPNQGHKKPLVTPPGDSDYLTAPILPKEEEVKLDDGKPMRSTRSPTEDEGRHDSDPSKGRSWSPREK